MDNNNKESKTFADELNDIGYKAMISEVNKWKNQMKANSKTCKSFETIISNEIFDMYDEYIKNDLDLKSLNLIITPGKTRPTSKFKILKFSWK